MGNDNITGLILTAGYSSRMGMFKPLLQIGNATAIEMVAASLKKAGISNIIGVTGFQRERLTPIFAQQDIVEAYNQDFEQGMFTSIKRGIMEALHRFPKPQEGFFLMLVDSPLVTPDILQLIIKKHEQEPNAFIVPCYHGKKGHPLFIPSCYAEEILAYEGDGGLKAITNRYEDQMIRLTVESESVVLDMDTPEGYREILDHYQKQLQLANSNTPAHPFFDERLRGKRLVFIRHGEIRQHSEKIFLGQTDVPLSERGKKQAENTAEELIKQKVSVNRIYTSDLSRAFQTAEIIMKHLNRIHGYRLEPSVIKEPKLREMCLGEWDGQLIREIKENYPEEYQKRGENLLTYKFGNESENFYDLQYRALKGLKNILKREAEEQEGARDILIVSHRGVINGIRSYLNHKDLGEEVNKPIANGGMIVMDFT